ncbi:hypothetical protein [Rosenbergiella nectarea]|uniref:hypothetical protein n=1 Tax=Rosenbergiella nectarea TaxID=988801 RepID=UPI001F4DBA36|nr:hypothetical protein [Rosenbergiella nectarea]
MGDIAAAGNNGQTIALPIAATAVSQIIGVPPLQASLIAALFPLRNSRWYQVYAYSLPPTQPQAHYSQQQSQPIG